MGVSQGYSKSKEKQETGYPDPEKERDRGKATVKLQQTEASRRNLVGMAHDRQLVMTSVL